jgi:taurine dioxygenase
MAPSLEEPVVTQTPVHFTVPVSKKDLATSDNKFGYQPGRTVVTRHDNYAYEDFLPSFPNVQWPPLEYTPYEDKGLRGDPKFRNLLRDATAVFDYNPKIGTEIHGVDLASLDDAQRDDLARLIAFRGVVFFRSQKNFDIDAQRALGRYWGKLHKVSASPTNQTTKKKPS